MSGKKAGKGYKVQEKFWIISEVKASMIEVFNNFLDKQDIYVRSLKHVVDPGVAKAEYTAALYGFYTLMVNGFVRYLEDDEVKIGYTEKDYCSLAVSNEHKDDDLVMMGYELNKWASCYGPFRITHQEKVFDNQVEQLKYEDSM